jgi:hypothetical protein
MASMDFVRAATWFDVPLEARTAIPDLGAPGTVRPIDEAGQGSRETVVERREDELR